jgi:hypothetical protein
MAKHKINSVSLQRGLESRWLFLNEHNLSGTRYDVELDLLDNVLSDDVCEVTDDVTSSFVGVQTLGNFAPLRFEGQDSGKLGGVSRLISGTAPNVLTGGIPSTEPDKFPSEKVPFGFGGYDGGIEIGFDGTWNPLKFGELLLQLEESKNLASEELPLGDEGIPLEIGGEVVVVFPSGGKVGGLLYKYRFMVRGVEFLIHSNPPKNRQPIRIRYTADSLIGNNFFVVHNQFVLPFISSLGFIVTSDKPSRIDMQVMVDVPVDFFVDLVKTNQLVTKFRNYSYHGKLGGKVETFTVGSISKVEICIYDKRLELSSKKSSIVKEALFIEKCVGVDWWNSDTPITRIEVRLGREALKSLGVDTVSDLQERERAIIDLVSNRWFRFLSSPKIRGHENSALIHPVWERVRELFFRNFSGAELEVEWSRNQSITCDPEALEKQALGCLSKALSYRHGKQDDLLSVKNLGFQWIGSVGHHLYEKVNKFSEYVLLTSGVELGSRVDSYVDDYLLPEGHIERIRNSIGGVYDRVR